MHDIEPYWNWRHRYTAEEDERSPFFGEEHSEFEFTHAVYDHVLHPQWDTFGSSTLYIKMLFADYEDGFVILELIGEWNDLLHNDIMVLKRNIIEHLMAQGINKFVLLGENVMTFHAGDDEYYSEWFEETSDTDGWVALVNFRTHVLEDMSQAGIDQYVLLGGSLNEVPWRTGAPEVLFERVGSTIMRRLGA